MKNVPTISLAAFRAGELTADDWQALDTACRDHGFFILTDHGADSVVRNMWQASRAFFTSDRGVKLSVLRDAENPLGFYDRELTKQKRDQKEVFDFKCGGHQSSNPARRSRWPSALPQLREALQAYFDVSTDLARETATLVFEAMGMSKGAAQELEARCFGARHTSAARLNYYPSSDPLPASEREGVNALGDMALHHHTDPGGVTLLLQDDVGGLQAHSSSEGWIDVPPCGNDFVVNLGDVMQVWTNDRYKAAVHRVLPVPKDQPRFSTPFFYQPCFDEEIAPMHVEGGGDPRYRPFTWREFIRGRVTDNYADVGEEDIQISRYAAGS